MDGSAHESVMSYAHGIYLDINFSFILMLSTEKKMMSESIFYEYFQLFGLGDIKSKIPEEPSWGPKSKNVLHVLH